MKCKSVAAALLLLLVGVVTTHADAQVLPQANVTRALGNGRYEVQIGGVKFTAVPDSAAQRMLLERASSDSARAQLAAAEKLLKQFQQFEQSCTILNVKSSTYVGLLEEQLKDYIALTDNYRKLARSATPRFSIIGGVGATGGDKQPAIFAGVEIGKIRILGFGQESNAGVLVGRSFTLF